MNDSFLYDDGTDLSGTGGGWDGSGGQFTSDWLNDPGTPAGTFVIENGQAVIGDTGGLDVSISRGIDVTGVTFGCPTTDPTCASSSPISTPGTNFIFAQMTQIEDNHAAYEASLQFSDSFGITAAFGIVNDGSGDPLGPAGHNDYFFAELGGTRIVSTVAADADTPFFIYAAVDFDTATGNDERLRLWINPLTSDFLNGVNADIDMSVDLDASGTSDRGSLGDQMTLLANTQEAGTLKSFDDIIIAKDAEFLGAPRIDIGDTDIQVAFEAWDVGATGSPSFLTSYDLEDYGPSVGSQIVTLTLEANEAVNLIPFDETFATSGVADDLRKDGISAAGGYVLRFSDLLDDEFLVKTYHYHPTSGESVDVFRSYNGGAFAYFGTFVQATGGQAAREFMLLFDTHHGGDVEFMFVPSTIGGELAINGLQFVPEPGTALLLGIGLMGLSNRRVSRKLEK